MVEKFGSLDYVFANAGSTGSEVPGDFIQKPGPPDVSVCTDMVKGMANVVHAAAPLMLNEGGKSRDKGIIISGSESSFVNFSINPMYGMAKHAANGAAYCYAERLKPYGIRIVSFASLFSTN